MHPMINLAYWPLYIGFNQVLFNYEWLRKDLGEVTEKRTTLSFLSAYNYDLNEIFNARTLSHIDYAFTCSLKNS